MIIGPKTLPARHSISVRTTVFSLRCRVTWLNSAPRCPAPAEEHEGTKAKDMIHLARTHSAETLEALDEVLARGVGDEARSEADAGELADLLATGGPNPDPRKRKVLLP